MPLHSLVIPQERIPIPNNEDLVVRGLDPASLISLVRDCFAEMDALFHSFLVDGRVEQSTMESLALSIGPKAPELAAKIIACAADEPDLWPMAMNLPIADQLRIIDAVARLTFGEDGGLEKFMETALRMIPGMIADLQPNQISGSGSPRSEQT